MNLGPVFGKPKHSCPVCSKGVIASSKAAEYRSCGQKTHIRCLPAAITKSFNILKQKLYYYTCETCSKCEEDENHIPPPPPTNTNYSKYSTDTNFDRGAEQRFGNKNFRCFNRRGMHFIHMNIRSLVPKISEVRIIAEISKAAVIGICERWLDNSVNDAEIHIEGYTIKTKIKNEEASACTYIVNNKFASSKQELKNSEHNQSVPAEIYLPKTKQFTVGVVYRLPNDHTFLRNFEERLKCLRSDLDNIILGDFNICMKNKQDQLYEGYKGILNLYD